jgi:hypothetical protein
MKHNRTLFSLALLVSAACLLALAGCGGPSGDTAGDIAYVAGPNQDGFAGNSDIRFIGRAFDRNSGLWVEGYEIIHYAPGFEPPDRAVSAKPDKPPGKPPKDPDPPESDCFSFMGGTCKWKPPGEPWVVNPEGAPIGGQDMLDILANAIHIWEDAGANNRFGDGSLTDYPLWDHWNDGSPDGVNGAYFNVLNSGAIAVCRIWYNTRWNQILEWDEIYSTSFEWSTSGEAGKMDFWNIAQHELGHAFGLGHPADTCTAETMYRFAGWGETKKRTLEAGDIAGINAKY